MPRTDKHSLQCCEISPAPTANRCESVPLEPETLASLVGGMDVTIEGMTSSVNPMGGSGLSSGVIAQVIRAVLDQMRGR